MSDATNPLVGKKFRHKPTGHTFTVAHVEEAFDFGNGRDSRVHLIRDDTNTEAGIRGKALAAEFEEVPPTE